MDACNYTDDSLLKRLRQKPKKGRFFSLPLLLFIGAAAGVTNNSEFKKSGSDKLYIKTYNAGLETLNNLYLRSFSQWSSNSVQMTFFFFPQALLVYASQSDLF